MEAGRSISKNNLWVNLWYNFIVEYFYRPTRIFLQLFQNNKNRNIVTNYFYGLIDAAYRTYLEIDGSSKSKLYTNSMLKH